MGSNYSNISSSESNYSNISSSESNYSKISSDESNYPTNTNELASRYFCTALIQKDTDRCLKLIDDGVVWAGTLITIQSEEKALSRVCRYSFSGLEKVITALLVNKKQIPIMNSVLSNVVYHCPKHIDLILEHKQLTQPKALESAIITACKWSNPSVYIKLCDLIDPSAINREQHFRAMFKDEFTPNWDLIEHILTTHRDDIPSSLVIELLSDYLSSKRPNPEDKSLSRVDKIFELLGLSWTSLELRYPSK